MENLAKLLQQREIGTNPRRNRSLLKEWHRQNPRYIYINPWSQDASEILYQVRLMYPRANYQVIYGHPDDDSSNLRNLKKRKR